MLWFIAVPIFLAVVAAGVAVWKTGRPAAGVADKRLKNGLLTGLGMLLVASAISGGIWFFANRLPAPSATPTTTQEVEVDTASFTAAVEKLQESLDEKPVPATAEDIAEMTSAITRSFESNVITLIEALRDAPPSTPANTPGTALVAQSSCTGLAWHADNLPGTQVYDPSIIGGLDEQCWIVNQLWTNFGKTERWMVAVRPYSYVEIADHKGGSGWYFQGDDAAVLANLNEQAAQVLERDGPMETKILILPDQIKEFRLATRWAQKAATVSTPIAGACAGSTGTGPAIMEGEVDGKPTVIKLNSGQTYTLVNPGACYVFPSQSALDTRWPDHKREFLAKYPANGQAIEK